MNKDKKKKSLNLINIKNKKATFEYEISDKYVGGITLVGTEVKSIKQGKASLGEAYCYFKNDELWVKQMHIAHYIQGNINNHDETRVRKLLLKRKELNKLNKKREKGMTIIPLRLFINSRGFIKLEIALAKGKKLYDKRQSLKEKDLKKQINKTLSEKY